MELTSDKKTLGRRLTIVTVGHTVTGVDPKRIRPWPDRDLMIDTYRVHSPIDEINIFRSVIKPGHDRPVKRVHRVTFCANQA